MKQRKTIVITGSNGGVGLALSQALIKQGHQVIVVARDSEKTHEAMKGLNNPSNKYQAILVTGDLSSKASISHIIDEISRVTDTIDLLINNAGLYKRSKAESTDGLEMTFAVNVMGLIRLTEGLVDKIGPFDVVNITSAMFKRGIDDLNQLIKPDKFKGDLAYSSSKRLVMYYTYVLSKKLKDNRIIAMHPGVVNTGVFREYPTWFGKIFGFFIENAESAASKMIEGVMSKDRESAYYYNQNIKQARIADLLDEKRMVEVVDDLMALL